MKRLEEIESKIENITSIITRKQGEACAETEEKGDNIHRSSTQNPYKYGLQLMDVLFEKGEMASSLLFEPTKKCSSKPGLDKERVSKLFKMIEEKFGADEKYQKEWDLKLFIRKANQKCRDAGKFFSSSE